MYKCSNGLTAELRTRAVLLENISPRKRDWLLHGNVHGLTYEGAPVLVLWFKTK